MRKNAWISLAMAAILLLCTACGSKNEAKETETDAPRQESAEPARTAYEGEGFDTPEEAVLYFLQGLKNLDFERMLDAYAWETMISRYSMEAQFREDRTFSNGSAWLPGSDGFTRALNLAFMRELESKVITRGLQAFLLEDNRLGRDTEAVDCENEEAVRGFLDRYTAGRLEKLGSMANICFLKPEDVTKEGFFTDRKLEKMEKLRNRYGADELVYVPAVADIGDEKLFIAPTVVRYGGRWYLFSLESLVTGDIAVRQDFSELGIYCFSELPFSTDSAVPAGEESLQKAALPGIRYEGDGFDTPEEAVIWYLDGLKKLDPEQMLSAFAWETQASRYDPVAYIRLVHQAGIRSTLMPQIHEMAVRTDLHYLRGEQLYDIYMSVQRCLIPDIFPSNMEMMIRRMKSEEEVDTFLQHFNQGKLEELGGLENIRTMTPEEAIGKQYSEYCEAIGAEWLALYDARFGADEVREIVAIADVGSGHLFVAPTAARYGDRWYLVSLESRARNFFSLNGSSALAAGFACGQDFPSLLEGR